MCGEERNPHGLWWSKVEFESSLEGWVEPGKGYSGKGKDRSNSAEVGPQHWNWVHVEMLGQAQGGQKLGKRQGIGVG